MTENGAGEEYGLPMGFRQTAARRRRRPRRVATLTLAGLTLALVTGSLAAAPASADRAAPGLERALKRLTARPDGPPGAISIVQRPGGIKVFRAGAAELGTGERLRRRAAMRLASFSKAFSGAAALTLVDAGRLGLEDTIGEWLPDLPPAWHAVTLRQLLQHTSGMPDFSASEAFRDAFVASLTEPPPPRELLGYVAGEPLRFEAGSQYRYSNSDNVAVALIVEAVTGEDYAVALRSLVRRPLGLRQTLLPVGAAMPQPFIHGYAIEPPDPAEDVSELAAAGWSWASGGIVSTPNNLNRFVRGYLGRRLFGAAVQSEQLELVAGGRSEPAGPGANAAGLGIFRYRTRCGTVYGHTGNIFGYTQFAAANRRGTRSATLSISRQYDEQLLPALRRAEALAVCAALRR